jgi:hypothetical protein
MGFVASFGVTSGMECTVPDETLGHFERARIIAILEAVHAQDFD